MRSNDVAGCKSFETPSLPIIVKIKREGRVLRHNIFRRTIRMLDLVPSKPTSHPFLFLLPPQKFKNRTFRIFSNERIQTRLFLSNSINEKFNPRLDIPLRNTEPLTSSGEHILFYFNPVMGPIGYNRVESLMPRSWRLTRGASRRIMWKSGNVMGHYGMGSMEGLLCVRANASGSCTGRFLHTPRTNLAAAHRIWSRNVAGPV